RNRESDRQATNRSRMPMHPRMVDHGSAGRARRWPPPASRALASGMGDGPASTRTQPMASSRQAPPANDGKQSLNRSTVATRPPLEDPRTLVQPSVVSLKKEIEARLRRIARAIGGRGAGRPTEAPVSGMYCPQGF